MSQEQYNPQDVQPVEEMRQEVGGFVGPNREAICETCAKKQNWILRGDYHYFSAAPGWPRFTCEYCDEDF